jgi:hypothetical protein
MRDPQNLLLDGVTSLILGVVGGSLVVLAPSAGAVAIVGTGVAVTISSGTMRFWMLPYGPDANLLLGQLRRSLGSLAAAHGLELREMTMAKKDGLIASAPARERQRAQLALGGGVWPREKEVNGGGRFAIVA